MYPADPAPYSLQPVQVKIRDEDVKTNMDEYGLLFGVLGIGAFALTTVCPLLYLDRDSISDAAPAGSIQGDSPTCATLVKMCLKYSKWDSIPHLLISFFASRVWYRSTLGIVRLLSPCPLFLPDRASH